MEITLLLIQLVLSAVFFGWQYRRSNLVDALAKTAVVLFVPIFGIVIMVILQLICHFTNIAKGEEPEKAADGEAFFRGVALDQDIIPLNDAFLVDDIQRKRQYFTDAIKQSVVDNQAILQMAMHDSDREIAYYAVSMQTTHMEKLESKIFAKERQLAKLAQPEITMLQEYEELIREYLANQDFVDHVTWRNKQLVYIELLQRLILQCPQEIKYYESLIKQLLDVKNYQVAENICQQMAKAFPQTELVYLLYLELYQAWRKPLELQAKLQELKALPVTLSWQALQAIRFWGQVKISE